MLLTIRAKKRSKPLLPNLETFLTNEETVMDAMSILNSSSYAFTVKGKYEQTKSLYLLMEKYVSQIKDEKRQAQVTKSIEDGRKKLAMIGNRLNSRPKSSMV